MSQFLKTLNWKDAILEEVVDYPLGDLQDSFRTKFKPSQALLDISKFYEIKIKYMQTAEKQV